MSWERAQFENWYISEYGEAKRDDLRHVSSTDTSYASKATKLLWKVWVARSRIDWRTPDVDDI